MINLPDFSKKQILVVMCNEGDKLSFSNDNVVVKDAEGKTKIQLSLYRVFLIYCVGRFSITSPLIEKSKKFGFFIALMTGSFRLYELIGNGKEGNTLLKKRQYTYEELDIAKHIVKNKILMQKVTLDKVRKKDEFIKEAIPLLDNYYNQIDAVKELNAILAYEGLAAKVYFRNHFNNAKWIGRQPRIKRDYINATLDIGYTLLFGFIEAILLAHGFDVYCGVLHRQFYMRKSLVCDLIEPFRFIIDTEVKKAINLKQVKEEDFIVINQQYKLKWEKSSSYVGILMKRIMESKEEIFQYIQKYYRCFMKELPIENYPVYRGEFDDNNQL